MLSELGNILRKSIHEKKDSLKNSSDVSTKHEKIKHQKNILSFEETEIPPLCIKSITSMPVPMVYFKPERLIIPHAVADLLLINDIKIGKYSQLNNSLGISGVVFSERSSIPSPRLKMNTCSPSLPITIEVENLTDKPLKFAAIMTGIAITGKQEP